jgi:hypothetical protein
MGTLIFVCPTTGHQVSTGVEVDRSSYKRLPRTKTAIFCPRCHKNHLLSRIWAWLDSNDPKIVVTDAVPSAAPCRSELTLAGRRSARPGVADKKSEVDETKAVIRY